jgi:hypothetical protein
MKEISRPDFVIGKSAIVNKLAVIQGMGFSNNRLRKGGMKKKVK